MAVSDNIKQYTEAVNEARDLAKTLQKDIGDSLSGGLLNALGNIEKLDKATTKYGKNQKKLYEESIDLTKDILDNVSNIGTEEFKTFDVATKLAKARRGTDQTLVKQLTHLKSINKLQQQQHKQIQDMVAIAKKPFESIDSFIRQIPIVGDLLADVADFTGLGDNFATGMVEGFTSGFVENANLADKMSNFLSGGSNAKKSWNQVQKSLGGIGLTAEEIQSAYHSQDGIVTGMGQRFKGLNISMKGMVTVAVLGAAVLTKMAVSMISFANSTGLAYKDMFRMGGALLVNADAVRSFADELGTVNNLTTMQALALKIQEKRYGLTAESAAKLFAVQRGITGSSMDQFLALTKSTAQLARMAGVAPKAVFEDMAQNAEFIAKFSDATGDNMKKTAIEAQRLGINLSTVDKIAESLLDFETSIGNEMEAAMLLGKNINMDKARELMFTGKTDLALQEVVKQLGVVGNLSELDFVQRKAISTLLGTDVAELSKIIGAQEGVNEATKKTVSGAAMLGIGLGAAAGLAAAIVPAMISTIPGLQKLGVRQLLKGLGVVAMGAGAGGIAGGMIGGFMTESKGKLPELQHGGVIVGEKGPELVAPIPAEGVNVDTRKMESLLGQMLVQYEFLMNRLTSRVDGLALSS